MGSQHATIKIGARFFIKKVEPKNLPVQNMWPKLNINNLIYSNLPLIYRVQKVNTPPLYEKVQ